MCLTIKSFVKVIFDGSYVCSLLLPIVYLLIHVILLAETNVVMAISWFAKFLDFWVEYTLGDRAATTEGSYRGGTEETDQPDKTGIPVIPKQKIKKNLCFSYSGASTEVLKHHCPEFLKLLSPFSFPYCFFYLYFSFVPFPIFCPPSSIGDWTWAREDGVWAE